MDDALVGRETERAAVAALVDDAIAGRAAIGLVGGEAGSGKSELVRSVLADRSLRPVTGFGAQEGSAAYGPLVEVMRDLVRRRPDVVDGLAPVLRSHLAVVVPELGDPAPRLDGASLFEAVRSALTTAAATDALVVVLDDMQWADDGTLDLLPALARALVDEPAVLLVVYRTDVLPRQHGVRRLRAELRRARLLHEIELGPLDAAATRALLERTVGAPVDASLVDTVLDRTEGVPFFVGELGLALSARDRLGEGRGGLALIAGADLPLPESVRDAILLRAAALSDEGRRAVDAAAVAGQRFDVEGAVRIAGLDDWPDDPGLAAVVVDRGDGQMAFRQALVRDAFYSEVPGLTRRRLHRLVAERLEAAGAAPGVVAEHWASAGEHDRARSCFVAAAQAFCALHAHRDGVRAARRALELWPDPAADGVTVADDGRAAALDVLARCAELAGLPGDAVAARRELLEVRRRLGEPRAIADAGRNLAGALEVQGRWEEALAARDGAAAAYADAGAMADAATERLTAAAHLRSASSFGAARAVLAVAAVDARAAGRLDLQARIAALDGNVRARGGDPAGIDVVREALALALAHDLTAAAGEVYQRLADSLEHAGNYAAARAVYDEAFAFCVTNELDPTAQVCLGCLSAVLRQNGDWDRAVDVCRSVLAAGAATQHARAAASGTLGSVLALRGDAGRARALLLEAQTLARAIELTPMELVSEWGLALVDWTRGDSASAATRCRAVLERWRRSEDRHYAIAPLRWAASLLAEVGDGAGAQACAGALSQILSSSGRAEAASALAHALGETAMLEGDVAQAAEQFVRAIALLDGVDAPFEVVESQRRAASALAATGRHEDAVEAIVSAYRTCRRLKAQPLARRLADDLSALGESVDRRLGPREAEQLGAEGLSRRELDIVRLVATGRTNREIAKELVVSVRTVDMHVRNSLRKLGCRSRADATRRAGELGLLRTDGTR